MKFYIAFLFILSLSFCTEQKGQIEQYDVLVIGGGASGTMAGIQAARLGSSTLILEETPWLGGMLTSAGVSAIDGNYKLSSGLWHEFRKRLYTYYGGEDSVKTGWVSNVLFEPNVGAEILAKMAAEENRLTVSFNSKAISLKFENDFWIIKVIYNGTERTIQATIIVDGTELGDISKMAGIPYDIGMDSRLETKEDIAPELRNDIIQDMTYVAILKDYGNEHQLLEKPSGYDPSIFFCSCAGKCARDTITRKLWDCNQMINYGKLPNNKYMINWPIYGNDFYANVIELDELERIKAYGEAKLFTKCYVYYLQNELGFAHLGIADDVFPTNDGFPFYPYHRESRRIKGIVRFNINDIASPFEQADALYRTGIAVGDYPVDHHHEAFTESKKLPDLHFYPVPSYSIPLGTLIPSEVNNFIVAEKSISVTNLVNGTTRLQPVCLLIGQAAGALAHLSVENKKTPKEINIRAVQDILLDAGAYIMPYSDVNPDDLSFNSVQKIGATGILKGEGKNIGWENHTLFHPDSVLTLNAISAGLEDYCLTFDQAEELISVKDAFEILMDINTQLEAKNKIEPSDLNILWSEYQFGELKEDQIITRKQFAVLLDKMVDPFHEKQIDHFGRFLE